MKSDNGCYGMCNLSQKEQPKEGGLTHSRWRSSPQALAPLIRLAQRFKRSGRFDRELTVTEQCGPNAAQSSLRGPIHVNS